MYQNSADEDIFFSENEQIHQHEYLIEESQTIEGDLGVESHDIQQEETAANWETVFVPLPNNNNEQEHLVSLVNMQHFYDDHTKKSSIEDRTYPTLQVEESHYDNNNGERMPLLNGGSIRRLKPVQNRNHNYVVHVVSNYDQMVSVNSSNLYSDSQQYIKSKEDEQNYQEEKYIYVNHHQMENSNIYKEGVEGHLNSNKMILSPNQFNSRDQEGGVQETDGKDEQIEKGGRRGPTTKICEHCGRFLQHPSKIAAHMRTHTGERPFLCDICGQDFSQRTPYRMHVKRHIGDLPFACLFCTKQFPNNSSRNGHELRVHRGGFKGNQGWPKKNLSFPSTSRATDQHGYYDNNMISNLIEHSSSLSSQWEHENGEMMDSNKISNIVEAVASGSSDTISSHHSGFISEQKDFQQANENMEIQQMLITHENRPPPTISECCGMIFKHPSKIQAHLRTHTGEKPFKCRECGLGCSTNSALRVHIRRFHTGERPHECNWNCGMRFVSVAARNEHERIVHAGIKRYQCIVGICRRLFTRRNYLIKHLSKEHPRELTSNNLVDFSRVIPFHQPVAKRLINPNIHKGQKEEDEYANYEEGGPLNYSNIYIENGEAYINEKLENGEMVLRPTDMMMQMYPEEEEMDSYALENQDFPQLPNEYSGIPATAHDGDEALDEVQQQFYESTGEIHERLYTATSLPPAKGRKGKNQENIEKVYVDSSVFEFAAPQTSRQRHLKRKCVVEKNHDLDDGISMDEPALPSIQIVTSSEPGCSLEPQNADDSVKLEENHLDQTIDSIVKNKIKSFNKNGRIVGSRKPATQKKCEYCGKDLKYPSKIEAHMRTHTGSKPFKCAICGYSSAQKTTLRMHLRRHLDQKPFLCPYEDCDRRYINGGLLNAHIQKGHGGARLSCSLGCGKLFRFDKERLKHQIHDCINRSLNNEYPEGIIEQEEAKIYHEEPLSEEDAELDVERHDDGQEDDSTYYYAVL